MADKKYEIPEDDAKMVAESTVNYGITIPVTVPTMGGYSLEELKHELNEFARKLVLAHDVDTEKTQHTSWRTMPISDKVKRMSLGKSSLSTDSRTTKQLLEESLQEKYV
ncbi:MAG: hypothetical protein MJY81_01325 [Bacteroidaceae bacterium]|nr:hypothetical protein [Bacteroidaceae bacterium]